MDILLLTETWNKNGEKETRKNIHTQYIKDNFKIYSDSLLERTDHKGNGTMMLIRNHIAVHITKSFRIPGSCTLVKLELKKATYFLGVFYQIHGKKKTYKTSRPY